MWNFGLLRMVVLVVSVFSVHISRGQEHKVDFRWGVDWWQTAICLPDDDHKSLVGKEGQLLYHFPGKYEYRGLGFKTVIWVDEGAGVEWHGQELFSPKVPLLLTYKSLGEISVKEEAFASIRQRSRSDAPDQIDMRDDIIIVTMKNGGAESKTIRPSITIQSEFPLAFGQSTNSLMIGSDSRLCCSAPLGDLVTTADRTVQHLETQMLAPGEEFSFVINFVNNCDSDATAITVEEAQIQKSEAISYWENLDLPYEKIRVPDAGIQRQLVSSIRNIYQAREIKNEWPAYQVGPTVYRDVWVIDSAFLLESIAMLGRVEDARNGINYLMSFRNKDGSFSKIDLNWKESGIVLWTCCRHAQLTQDKEWLEAAWPKLEWTAYAIKQLRKQTMYDRADLNYGLIPQGYPGGGLDRVDRFEYTNVYWSLAGMNAAIDAAHWLGKEEQAAEWQTEYDALFAAYEKASIRDLCDDGNGNMYVPTLMGNVDNESPQRAQWAFCHAIYPGKVFSAGDPIMRSTLNMLKAAKREGLVYGTGWMSDGLWSCFASFYGHARLWIGDRNEAIDSLYSFANHASPTLCWRREQNVKGEYYDRLGDMPYSWASAEFIRLTTSLLALERGNELHLFEGLPAEWVQPGMVTQLNGVLTRFGPLNMELEVSKNGKKATLTVEKLPAPELEKIVVHLKGWASTEKSEVLEFSGKKKLKKTIKIK